MRVDNTRIRLKGNYYVLEELKNGKVIKSWTLNPKKLLEMFKCPTENAPNVSKNSGKTDGLDTQRFSQDLLSEQHDTVEKLTQFSPDQIKKLEEINKGLEIEENEND